MSKRETRRSLGIQAAEENSQPSGLTLEQAVIEGYNLQGIEHVSTRSLKVSEKTFSFGRFTLTSTHLLMPEDATLEEWSDLGAVLFRMQGSLQWLIGDWLVYGETRFAQERRAVAEHFELELHTLDNYAWVARAVDNSLRKESLSFGHHALVAGKSPDEQAYWLEQAEVNQWSVEQFRKALLAQRLGQLTANAPALADQHNKRILNRVWRTVERGQPVQREDIAHLRRWLDAVERSFGTD